MNNSLTSKIYFPQCLCFLKITHLWKSIRVSSSHETNNTDGNGVNKHDTHTHTPNTQKNKPGKFLN